MGFQQGSAAAFKCWSQKLAGINIAFKMKTIPWYINGDKLSLKRQDNKMKFAPELLNGMTGNDSNLNMKTSAKKLKGII